MALSNVEVELVWLNSHSVDAVFQEAFKSPFFVIYPIKDEHLKFDDDVFLFDCMNATDDNTRDSINVKINVCLKSIHV